MKYEGISTFAIKNQPVSHSTPIIQINSTSHLHLISLHHLLDLNLCSFILC
jgi:hypothetical protein